MSQTCHKRYSFLTIISSLLFPHFTWIHLKKKRGEDSEFRALSGFKLEDLAVQLQERGGKDLATAAILDMARQAGLSVNDQKALLGFSSTSWKDVAPRFKLDPSKDMNQLQYFSLPIAQLSPSFHREVMVASAKWLDVFQESGGEAAQMRLMGAWHVPVCALFKGRLVDQPKSSMSGSLERISGGVDHKVFMVEGIILFVTQLKLENETT